ncbi:MAG: type II toxin-antitoxin system HipA family toxinoxin YjjJ [Variovorax sp.]|nr:MAG: type II toxin-antitoxin system HipA family toxinoxin YjjJ [Variovorax sp.]
MPAVAAASPEQLQAALAHGPAGASELAATLKVSVPTLHRLLQRLPSPTVRAGAARRTRYALARTVRGAAASFPVYAVDAGGRVNALSPISPVRPEGSWMQLAGSDWPVPAEARDGWWEGLPYPLHQMRPQGYMGRQFARAQAQTLGVPSNPLAWSDDDVLVVLSQRCTDVSGNLILGDMACEQWLATRAHPEQPLPSRAIGERYLELAEQAVAAGVAGSSAGGEFPKFTAQRALRDSATPHVLVKFSGSEDSAAVRRWSDLLVCEHLAAVHAEAMPGIVSARTRIVVQGGRTFLEVERFDRHGEAGRSPLCALDILNATFLGDSAMDWPHLVGRLASLGLVGDDDLLRTQRLWWFGRLIANTDMHMGNLSFRAEAGRFALAPMYDMLPMRYAPLGGGEVPHRSFEPALPLPAQRAAWLDASVAAHAFWLAVAGDGRIGDGFRAIATANAIDLARLQDKA